MNHLRVLRTLLWKDYRVHRPILILGLVLLLLPYVGVLLASLISGRELAATWTADGTIEGMAYSSLALSLVTIIGLAGSAFAAEREDRSCEFLACLPASRFMNLCSKIVLITAVIALIWSFNLALLFKPESRPTDSSRINLLLSSLGLVLPTGLLLFGAAWLASTWLRQSTIASACGLAAPVLVGAGIQGLQLALAPETFEFRVFYRDVCLTLGIFSFLGGCAVYLTRFKP